MLGCLVVVGLAPTISTSKVVLLRPAPFRDVTVKVRRAKGASGVPLIAPVLLSRASAGGKGGQMLNIVPECVLASIVRGEKAWFVAICTPTV